MTVEMTQGEIWMADLPAPLNPRPVLILTRTNAIQHLQNVTVATISSRVRGLSTEVELSSAVDHVPQNCAVSLDNIITLPKAYLDYRICTLSASRRNEVFEAVHTAFELPF